MPDDEKVHPLIIGKTPLELEEMSYEEISVHLDRAKAYLFKVEDEMLIHIMIRFHENGRDDLTGMSRGTDRYERCKKIAQKRIGL